MKQYKIQNRRQKFFILVYLNAKHTPLVSLPLFSHSFNVGNHEDLQNNLEDMFICFTRWEFCNFFKTG
jgi:hypothetical protein